MEKETIFPSRMPKKPPHVLWLILLFSVMISGVYICLICLKQISVPLKAKDISLKGTVNASCDISDIPLEEIDYVHFPQPKTYSREECSCTPVRFFVIMSMQRSGSRWFETLLNSHPNISSNGEIFYVKQRRSNMSTIYKTLDSVYRLEWISSAAKNDCVAAVGFKWMLNQAVMDYHTQVVNYFNWKGVSVIFLFRRNLLRRHISVLANNYDRNAKLVNGVHKAHVYSREEADLLAQFKPTLNVGALIRDLTSTENAIAKALKCFRSTRHMILYYEDLIKDSKALIDAQEFLRVPVRNLNSRQVKIHIKPLSEEITNWEDVSRTLEGSQYAHFFQSTGHKRDYNSLFTKKKTKKKKKKKKNKNKKIDDR